MRILFLHGYGTQPGGIKPTFLESHGHEVFNPALAVEDFSESVRIAPQAFDEAQPEVVVGAPVTFHQRPTYPNCHAT